MEFINANVGGEVCILRNDHFVAIPVTLDFTNVATTDNGYKIVKAGAPIKSGASGWVASNDANATAILLHDVREDRPIGSAVIHGFINKAVAEASYGSQYSNVSISNVDIR